MKRIELSRNEYRKFISFFSCGTEKSKWRLHDGIRIAVIQPRDFIESNAWTTALFTKLEYFIRWMKI